MNTTKIPKEHLKLRNIDLLLRGLDRRSQVEEAMKRAKESNPPEEDPDLVEPIDPISIVHENGRTKEPVVVPPGTCENSVKHIDLLLRGMQLGEVIQKANESYVDLDEPMDSITIFHKQPSKQRDPVKMSGKAIKRTAPVKRLDKPSKGFPKAVKRLIKPRKRRRKPGNHACNYCSRKLRTESEWWKHLLKSHEDQLD